MSAVTHMIESTSLKHANLINKIAAPLQTYFGIHYFCYQFISNDGYWFNLGNHPEWLLYCAEQQFYRYDPSLVVSDRYVASAHLVRTHQDERFQQTFIDHALKKFEIDHAFMLIKPRLDGCEHYFFAAPPQHSSILDIYISQFSRLNIDYAKYVNDQIQPIRDKLLERSVDLKQVNPERFYSSDGLLKTDSHLNGVQFSNAIQKVSQLSSRETECLTLYRQGFTAKQTAKRLGLSFRTVEDHFERIKIKFGVKSKQELLFIP